MFVWLFIFVVLFAIFHKKKDEDMDLPKIINVFLSIRNLSKDTYSICSFYNCFIFCSFYYLRVSHRLCYAECCVESRSITSLLLKSRFNKFTLPNWFTMIHPRMNHHQETFLRGDIRLVTYSVFLTFLNFLNVWFLLLEQGIYGLPLDFFFSLDTKTSFT